MGLLIATTHYRRPQYSARFFAALAACRGIGDCRLLVHRDWDGAHGDDCEAVGRLCESFAACPTEVRVSSPRRGVDLAKLAVLGPAFARAEYVLFLEDDTLPAPDALEWFAWAGEALRGAPAVWSVSGYSRPPEGCAPPDADAWALRPWFTSWGWASWRDRWDRFFPGPYLAEMGDRANGEFDWHLRAKFAAHGLAEAYPALARVQSVGGEDGEHTAGPAWHRAHEYNALWSGLDGPLPPVERWRREGEMP